MAFILSVFGRPVVDERRGTYPARHLLCAARQAAVRGRRRSSIGGLASRTLARALFPLLLISLMGCNNFFYLPSPQLVLTPDRIGLRYEDLSITTEDGVVLHGWRLFPAGERRGTILFFHGNAENISTHIASVHWLPQQGYEVILIDYRGYGRSQGKPTLEGLRADATAALRFVQRERSNIVVFGQSLGGAIAAYAVGSTEERKGIRALVLESAFSSYRTIAREKIGETWLGYPVQYLLAFLISDRYRPASVIDKVRPIPVLFIHGCADPIVPVEHSCLLYEEAEDPKELWLVPGGGHIAAFNRPDYRERLLAYLALVIPAGE